MGLETVARCDVTGSFHEVERYQFTAKRLLEPKGEQLLEDHTVFLCPAAFRRAQKFFKTGLVPPPRKDKSNGTELPAEDTVTNEDLEAAGKERS